MTVITIAILLNLLYFMLFFIISFPCVQFLLFSIKHINLYRISLTTSKFLFLTNFDLLDCFTIPYLTGYYNNCPAPLTIRHLLSNKT